ncbi:hypothetical protein [Mesorhizobium sp. KR2-14]|uniref:hypothetical protein n=1 Tax=Mesorhizobium sp. KR2-14 TaxID=3156610 RepID=UPI0032B3FCA2
MTAIGGRGDSLAKIASANVGTNATDRLTAVARALAGIVPGAGSALAEVITSAIPKQRLDRVAAFVVLLAKEVERLSAAEKLASHSSMPLIEEGISQASGAFSEQRRLYLAKCVAHGVNADEIDKLNELKILQLLEEVGDDELLLLDALDDPKARDKLSALQPPQLRANAPVEERAKGELHRASYRKLLSIGLLSSSPYTDEPRRWRYGKHGELEEAPYVSALGRMVLVRVGLRPGGPEVT